MWLFSLGENFAKMLARHITLGNFHEITPISFIKAYGFYFHVRVIFAKKTKALLEEIVDFVCFPCVAAAILGEIADNAINGSLLDTLVPKLEEIDDELVFKLSV